MSWSYMVVALVGAFIGFAGQFIADYRCNAVVVDSSYKAFPDEGHYSWVYTLDDRCLGSPYHTEDGKIAYPGVPDTVPKYVTPPAADKSRWRILFHQLHFLYWLQWRGELATRNALITSLLSLLLVFSAKRLQSRRNSDNQHVAA